MLAECITFFRSRQCHDSVMSTVPPIPTERFELVSMSLPFMRALRAHDFATAETEIGAAIPADMPDDLEHFLEFRIADLSADPAIQPWLGRAIVLDDGGGRRIIGSVGFHAPPDQDGRVEVGYRVDPAHRRQGVATEVVRALFDWACREHGVTRFRAATAPDNVASQGVLAHFGFRQVGIQMDEYDGPELVFERDDWATTT
jgi:RimJ/RimL family protein N-acetyltransferase